MGFDDPAPNERLQTKGEEWEVDNGWVGKRKASGLEAMASNGQNPQATAVKRVSQAIIASDNGMGLRAGDRDADRVRTSRKEFRSSVSDCVETITDT